MEKKDTFIDKLAISAGDALNPINVLFTILKFMFFGILIGLPYLIYNLDKVFNSTQTNFLPYLSALGKTLWQGIFLGLSTVWETFINIINGTIGKNYASIGFSVLILIFSVLTFHQIIRILFNIFDMKKGRATPKTVTLFVALIITLFIISPFSNIYLKGETITSGVKEEEVEPPSINTTNNESINTTLINNETNIINLLGNGG